MMDGRFFFSFFSGMGGLGSWEVVLSTSFVAIGICCEFCSAKLFENNFYFLLWYTRKATTAVTIQIYWWS